MEGSCRVASRSNRAYQVFLAVRDSPLKAAIRSSDVGPELPGNPGQVQELREKLSATKLSMKAQEAERHAASSRQAARSKRDHRVHVSPAHEAKTGFRESLAASPCHEKVTSPSNDTKRSTAASSSERPLSPRYEGQPMTEGIAVWRETQALKESLGASSSRAHRPLTRAAGTSSPNRQRPAVQTDGLEPVTQVLSQQMPPWTSTFGFNLGAPNSPQSASQLPPFAEAAMSRLTWLQAEKEALEGWLSNAGYLSVSKDSDDSRGRVSEDVAYAQEPTASLAGHHVFEGMEIPGRLQEERPPERVAEEPWSHLPPRLSDPRPNDRTRHAYATGHTPDSSVEEGSPSTPGSARRKSLAHQSSYNALAAERAAAGLLLRSLS